MCPNLFGGRWPATGLAAAIAKIDVNILAIEYATLQKNAPRRSQSGKPYFVGHSGVPSSKGETNRLEEHMAIALLNLDRCWPLPRSGWFRFLDYQVPLKATQADARIGKIDLLGVSDQGRLVVAELKVVSQRDGRSDPPPAALMEGLRYAAMVQADQEAIRAEARQKFGVEACLDPPIVVLLAPSAWWTAWGGPSKAGDWGHPFASLMGEVEEALGVSTECLALDDSSLTYGGIERAPRLEPVPG